MKSASGEVGIEGDPCWNGERTREGAPFVANPWYPRHPRRAASIVAMLIFFICIIASKARFASPPPAAGASVRVRPG
jgi:hypothetical protein